MTSEPPHSTFGTLVRDQWGDDLLTFRHFPHMQEFWQEEPDAALASSSLSDEQRAWVQNWQDHTAELAQVCRNAPVHAALQSLGVYEVTLSVPQDDEPSAAQEAAYRFFSDHEQQICANVVAALTRYYNFASTHLADWFDADEDLPEDPTPAQLGKAVAFDGFHICRCSSNGMSPLRFAWDPDWDPEHGLLMAVYKDQVIGIGTDDVDDLLHDPQMGDESVMAVLGLWGHPQMTAAERNAFEEFADGHEPAEDVEDE